MRVLHPLHLPLLARLPFRAVLALGLALLVGCTSLSEHIDSARALDDAALTGQTWPEEATWIVVAGGEVAGALSEEQALEIQPDAAHRYLFQPAAAGDTRPRMAYRSAAPLVGGRELAAALGLGLRRDADGGAILTRDTRRMSAEAGGSIILQVSAPDGTSATPAAILLDPDFQGPLLVTPSIAERLGLRRFEIPGEAQVDVALGRPFRARRSRVLITAEKLGVSGTVEVLFPY